MFTFRRLATVFPLLFLFSLLVIHVTAQPHNTTIQVETGTSHTCGIRTNGTLACWGGNEYEQSTVPPDLGTVKAVGAGGFHTCAIKTDDTLRCWGRNNDEQSTVPSDLGTVKSVNIGVSYACAIKSDDTLRCWGFYDYDQTTLPADVAAVKAVSAGDFHTCAIKSDDTLRCWGGNLYEQSTVPADLAAVKSVSAGSEHTCAIKSDDILRCWGRNDYEQSAVPADLGTVKAVGAGGLYTCAIKSDDTLRCWGDNTYEQSTVPDDLGTVKAVSVGRSHICAIKSDDTLMCWGNNSAGQSAVPKPPVTLTTSSLVLMEGKSMTIKANVSEYLWMNVVVSLSYTGTAVRNTDYNATSAVFMTTADNAADLLITTLDDSQIEPDETIVIDIASVTGGTENGTQQVTLVIQDNDSVTPTPTDAPQTNLTVNSGFEDGQTGWTVKRGVGEKVKCNKEGKPPVARSGTCAFQFKGGAGERSAVEQTLAAQTWAAGDTLNLSAFVKATNSAANGRVRVRVKYSDGTATGKIDADIRSNSDYTELTGSYALLSANVSRVKLSIQNRSAAGKVFVDDVELLKGGGSLLSLP